MKEILLIGGTGGIGLQLFTELSDRGYPVRCVGSKSLDLSDPVSIEDFFENHLSDVVVFLSMVNFDSFLHKLEIEKLRSQIEVNVSGFAFTLRCILKKMRGRGFGDIIYLSSILSRHPLLGTGIYSASKSFCDTLVRVAALENANKGVRLSSIQMGYFEGGMTERIPNGILTTILGGIPKGRLGKVSELANAIEFLIQTDYATGLNLTLAGGLEAK